MKILSNNMYLLLIDEEAEIKENTWYENKGLLFLSDCKYDEGNNPNNSNPRVTDFNNSIIAYYPLSKEAKKLDLPLLPPFEEVNIEKLAFNYTLPSGFNRTDAGVSIMEAFIAGYKVARKLPKEFILGEGNTIEEQIKNGYYIW